MLRGLALAALVEARRWHGTHCPRRLLLRDETSRSEGRRGSLASANEREKERRESQRVRQPRRRSNRQTQAPFLLRSFPSSASLRARPLRLLFLLLLSFARLSCHAGDRARVKTTYVCLARAPGSRSLASRPMASLLLSLPPSTPPPSFFLPLPRAFVRCSSPRVDRNEKRGRGWKAPSDWARLEILRSSKVFVEVVATVPMTELENLSRAFIFVGSSGNLCSGIRFKDLPRLNYGNRLVRLCFVISPE